MSKVIVIGSEGFIGGHLVKAFSHRGYRTIGIDRTTKGASIELNAVDAFDFGIFDPSDLVIVTAAISSPDLCAKDYESAWNVNVSGTSALIEGALRRGARLLFFSSDAVYASRKAAIYDESCAIDPRFAYGKMKAEIERRFSGEGSFKALRLSYVASKNDKITSYLWSCLKKGCEAEIYHPYYRNSIPLCDVVDTVLWLGENWADFKPQALNCAGVELVSRLRMADEFSSLYPELRYSIREAPCGFYDNRPAITQMRSLYLYDLGIVRPRSFSESYRGELKGI